MVAEDRRVLLKVVAAVRFLAAGQRSRSSPKEGEVNAVAWPSPIPRTRAR